MHFSTRVVAVVVGVVALSGTGCYTFTSKVSPTFVSTSRSLTTESPSAFGVVASVVQKLRLTQGGSKNGCGPQCSCDGCANRVHGASCDCSSCRGQQMTLGMTADDNEQGEEEGDAEEGAKAEEEEGAEAEAEASGDAEAAEEEVSSPPSARRGDNRKDRDNVALEDFEVGSTVEGTVRSVVSYGAFVDVGAATDSLLHVSAMSQDFVSNPQDIVSVGDKVQVRILSVDVEAKKIAVSMKPEKAAAAPSRPQRQRGPPREAQTAALKALEEAGVDEDKFVSAEVVATVDFGAFVMLSVGDLVEGVEGQVQGLVHISALCQGRVDTVDSIVKVGDTVQVRVLSLDAAEGKIGLSMIGGEGNPKAPERAAGAGGRYGGYDDDDDDSNVSVYRGGGGGGISTFDSRDYSHLGITDAINEQDLAYNQDEDDEMLAGISLSAKDNDDGNVGVDLWSNDALRAQLDEIAAQNLLNYDQMGAEEDAAFLENYVDDYDAPDLSNARAEDFGGIWDVNDKREWVSTLAEWNESQPPLKFEPIQEERPLVNKKKTWQDKLDKIELEAAKKRNRNRRKKRDGVVETP